MKKTKTESFFWTSYSDLMTSLFFVMLVLLVLMLTLTDTKEFQAENNRLRNELQDTIRAMQASEDQLKNILQLGEQFETLGQSSSLGYDTEKKMFYAKDLLGIEIFEPNKDEIKSQYLKTVDAVGEEILSVLDALNKNPNFSYLMIIEGTAAIPWDKKRTNNFNPDNVQMYRLSYNRALTLYNRWRNKGIDFRQYNTEVIIAGSGFNGINRDEQVEDNNKRFVLQIIPKINRPKSGNQ